MQMTKIDMDVERELTAKELELTTGGDKFGGYIGSVVGGIVGGLAGGTVGAVVGGIVGGTLGSAAEDRVNSTKM
jgi:outer membrane lipoprotein SlyB